MPGDSLPGQSGTIRCVLVIKMLISTALSDGGGGTHLIVFGFFTFKLLETADSGVIILTAIIIPSDISGGSFQLSTNLLFKLGLPFTHKIKLDSKIQAVYTLRHEPTKPNQTDPDEECKHKIRLQFA